MKAVLLSPSEQQFLEEIAISAPEALKRRANVILHYSAGMPTRQVILEVDLSAGRARYWRRRFKSEGMAIFPIPASLELPSQLEKSSSPGIRPDDLMSEAGRKIWRFHFAEMLRHEEGACLGDQIEELHDMRVATRRLRAAYEIFAPAFKRKRIKPFRKGLRAVGHALGEVRDLDVLIEKATLYLESLPPEEHGGLDHLLIAWQEQRALRREQMLAHLQSEAYHQFKQAFNAFLETPGMGAPQQFTSLTTDHPAPLPTRVCEIAPSLIYNRLAAVRAFDVVLNTASIVQLHALRIEFKKLRYTLEFFLEVLGSNAKEIIDEIKIIQDHLGDLNDSQVACQLLTQFLEECEDRQLSLPITERMSQEPILAYLSYCHAEKHRLLTTFPTVWVRFNRKDLRQRLAKAVGRL